MSVSVQQYAIRLSVLFRTSRKHHVTPDQYRVRAKLKARREPYWHRLNKGFYFGFRKMTPTSQGQWIIRSMDGNAGKETYKTLGEFADVAPADRFDAASKETAGDSQVHGSSAQRAHAGARFK